MKILQVCAVASPYGGNFISSLKKLAIAMREQGYETIYAFPETAKERDWVHELQRETKVYFLPLAKARIKPQTYLCFRRIYKENPDLRIVHSHYELYDVPATITAPSRIKVFWHLHDSIEGYKEGINGILNKLQYGVCHRHAKLISVSEKHMEYVISIGFPKEQAYYLPNGLDTDRIKPVESERNGSRFDFLMFGTDYKVKGVDLCFAAQKQMAQPVRIGIVCEERVQKRLQELYGVVDGIELLTPIEDVSKLYAQSKCFLHISRREGFSYALLEAIYAGLPVICSDIRENEHARQMPTVTMVESENVSAISTAMIHQLKNGVSDADIAKSRRIIEEKYSLNAWIDKMMGYYFA